MSIQDSNFQALAAARLARLQAKMEPVAGPQQGTYLGFDSTRGLYRCLVNQRIIYSRLVTTGSMGVGDRVVVQTSGPVGAIDAVPG